MGVSGKGSKKKLTGAGQQLLEPTKDRTERQYVSKSSSLANRLASSIARCNRSSSTSSAFESGSRGGTGQPISANEHQSDTRACISLHSPSAPTRAIQRIAYSPLVALDQHIKPCSTVQFIQLWITLPSQLPQLARSVSHPVRKFFPHRFLASKHTLVAPVELHCKRALVQFVNVFQEISGVGASARGTFSRRPVDDIGWQLCRLCRLG